MLLGLAVAAMATACGSDGGSSEELFAFSPPSCSGDPWPGGVRHFLTANDVMHRFKKKTGQRLINRVGSNNPRKWVVLSTTKSFSAVERGLDVHVIARGCSSYVPWL